MNIAVVDLETTGSDRYTNSIIEFGMVVVNRNLEELGAYNWVIQPDPAHLDNMVDVVRKMHTTNGLLDLLVDGITLDDADNQIAEVLDDFTEDGRIALAGSGVGHFDGPFIRQWMPHVSNRLTYWSYDVGPIRRTFKLAGVDLGPLLSISDTKNHRALDDARIHLHELQQYVNLFKLVPVKLPRIEG